MIWFVITSAIINILGGMVMETKDNRSFLVFKALPFFSGLGCLIYFLKVTGII